jgi:predicted lysophospholipase L1 biosynthesis ABC-type transport system permease subunit
MPEPRSSACCIPAYPAYPPDWAVLAGLGTALVTGILFGVLPARRAARLDPVESLAKRVAACDDPHCDSLHLACAPSPRTACAAS